MKGKSLQVTIIVGGVFDAFHLAEELDKQGYLERIITSYPYVKVRNEHIRREKTVSLVMPEVFFRLGLHLGFGYNMSAYYKAKLLGLLAKKRLGNCNLLFVYSGFGLEAIHFARRHGLRTILSRSSCHIQFQKEIMQEECARWGLAPLQEDIAGSNMVLRELEEYSQADYIRVPSMFARDSFLEKGISQEKLMVIPHGVDSRDFRPILKKDNIFRVLYVGGITLRKGIFYLLEAVRNLKLPNFELVLIGGINNRIKPLLHRYDGLFRYLGIINRRELYKYYSQASVFVLPSLEEGMAYVILEAMACGLPVITTNNSGGVPFVRHGTDGFIVPIRDPEAIRRHILLLYENETKRLTMSREALQRARCFGWGQTAGYAIKCFQAALDRRHPEASYDYE